MATARFEPGASTVVVSPTLIGANGRPLTISCALDTGATYLMIPWGVADALGLRPEVSPRRVELVTASGVERAPLVNTWRITE